jgi:hypothetical protein
MDSLEAWLLRFLGAHIVRCYTTVYHVCRTCTKYREKT